MTGTSPESEKLTQAVQDACPGQRIEGLFILQPPVLDYRLVPPRRQRPQALQGPEVKGAPWGKVGKFIGKLLTLDFDPPRKALEFPSTAKDRAELRKSSTGTSAVDETLCHAFGSGESHASRLQIAAFPQSKTSVQLILCVTPNTVKLLYTPYAKKLKNFAEVAEVGWQVNRRELAWTRSTAWKRGNQGIQYGFNDGSWTSFHTSRVAGRAMFMDVFPRMLTKEDPIPPSSQLPRTGVRHMMQSDFGGRSELHVGWLMPAFFHPLPVDVTDANDLADRVVELAKTLLADRDTDEQHFFAQMMLRQTVHLIEADAEYAGMCFVEHEGVPTMATVLVNRVPSLGETEEEAADATEALLKRRYPHDEVRTMALPLDATPAVTRTGGLEVTVPPELSPDGHQQVLPQGVVQAYVPLPGQRETMVFELTSPSPSAWAMYRDMFDAVLGTLDWATDEELAEQRELARIAGSPVPNPVQDESEAVGPVVAEAVRRRSSLVLDAVGLPGPIREDTDQLAGAACVSCRAKGLASACTVRHHWEMVGLTPAAPEKLLAATRTHLTRNGWTDEHVTADGAVLSGTGDAVSTQGYTITLRADAEKGELRVEVATVCTRGTATAVSHDFG